MLFLHKFQTGPNAKELLKKLPKPRKDSGKVSILEVIKKYSNLSGRSNMSLAEYVSRKLTKLFMKLIVHSMGNPFVNFAEIAFKKGTCCICGKKLRDPSLKESHFSQIQIFKKATWESGPMATITTRDGQSHYNFAVAVVCAECETASGNDINRMQSSVKFAVELDMRRKDIVYHDVKKLEDYPLIIEA